MYEISKSVAAMVSLEGTDKGTLCLYIQFLLIIIVNFDKDPNNTLFYTVYRLNPQKYGYKRRLIKWPSSQMKIAISILIQLVYHDMQHCW